LRRNSSGGYRNFLAMKRASNPAISILVPAFNQGRYLSRCIRSLLNQSEPKEDYEIVVIDDGSDDNTDQVLDAFSTVVRAFRQETNLGLPSALNVGLDRARGEFIVRVDADDFVNEFFLTCLRTYIQLNSECDAVACDYLLVDEEEQVLERKNAADAPIACGIMFKKSQMLKVGGYNERYLVHEDREFRLRFERYFEVERLAIPLYRYRRHGQNLTNDSVAVARFDGMLRNEFQELD